MNNSDIALSMEIQEKIIQFIIPVTITAVVSTITLITNSFLTIYGEIKKSRKDTYDNMKKFYPEFRTKLVYVDALYKEIINNEIYKKVNLNKQFDVINFLAYELDDFIEQHNLEEDQDVANTLYTLIQDLIKEIIQINTFLSDCIVPVHSKKAKFLMLKLHEYSVFVAWAEQNKIQIELKNLEYGFYDFKNIALLIKKMDDMFHKC